MTRSYLLVLGIVFCLFGLQLYGQSLPFVNLLSIALLSLLVAVAFWRWRRVKR